MDFLTHLKSFMNEDEANKLYDSLLEREIHCLRVNDLKVENINDLIEKSRGLEDHPHIKNAFIYNKSTFEAGKSILFDAGAYYIQEPAAMMAEYLLDIKENDYVLDMCAAPGSKTQYISELMNNKGKVLALDIHPHRVEIMKKMLSSLGLSNVTCICYDSTKLTEKNKLIESFDKVLLDAPCLGLGVVRRKPDILLNLKDENLDEIEAIQAKLLDQAYHMVKSGGTLVYSTCSINKKENDSQIMKFLSKHKDMKRVFEKQLFPDEYNSDGFYICKLIKE